MNEHTMIALAGIGVAGILSQWFAWWVKLPAILFLLLSGILAGPVLGWLDPDSLFGDLLLPMVSLAVAAILFEGSLTLRFEEIRGLERVVRRLVSIGVLVTWAITALAVHWLLDFPWELAFLFGAVTVVTGPTVIVPMLRTVRPTAHLANILRWEGIVIDPVGALLAVLVFELVASGQAGAAWSHTALLFLEIVAVGVSLGVAAGYSLGAALRAHLLPEYLHNVATLTLVFAVFALSNRLAEESGLLAVTVMGIWLANMKRVPVEDILNFKESLSVLLISGLFILLAARMNAAELAALGWGGLGVFLVIQFVARPLKVAVATWGTDVKWRERVLLSWIAPRGIVAAAVSALFALRLESQGVAGAQLLVPLTFMVIIGTVALQSATARPLARWLKVAEPEAKGFLIVGANPLARAVGEALCRSGFRTLLTDSSWHSLSAARMAGLAAWYGNPTSARADRQLDLVGLGGLLALSPQADLNALAVLRFKREFGVQGVYRLADAEEANAEPGAARESETAGALLFGPGLDYAALASALSEGAKLKETLLTEDFDFHDYLARHENRAIPLFAVTPKGRLRFFVSGRELRPEAGWKVFALVRNGGDSDAATAPTDTRGVG